ncbi:unnamed protein product [Ectocarpus sp. CCAP 1310/34]|nr:unnamed protein product [Ectocarpus sp. CCAP 1310/34]
MRRFYLGRADQAKRKSAHDDAESGDPETIIDDARAQTRRLGRGRRQWQTHPETTSLDFWTKTTARTRTTRHTAHGFRTFFALKRRSLAALLYSLKLLFMCEVLVKWAKRWVLGVNLRRLLRHLIQLTFALAG